MKVHRQLNPSLLYYIHAHGRGHRATFNLLYPKLSQYFTVIAITTTYEITKELQIYEDLKVIELPAKWPAGSPPHEHTFSKAFEVTPYHMQPAVRAGELAAVIQHYKPRAFYCDGSPELAIMVRGMGVPVVLVHLLGNTSVDPTQVFAYELADHIVGHFPAVLEAPDYIYADKTFYSGFMSRFSKSASSQQSNENNTVTILMGFDTYSEAVLQAITSDTNRQFTIIGNKQNYTLGKQCKQLGIVSDIATAIDGNIVISAAGQNSIAELISLNKKLILLPEPRPYDEQIANTQALVRNKLALQANSMFTAAEWQGLINDASNFNLDYTNLVREDAPLLISKKLKEWYA